MIKRVLVPLDGSRFASRALKYARELALRFNAEIVLVQIVKPAIPVPAAATAMPGAESPAAAQISVKVAMDEDKRNSSKAKRYLSGKMRGLKAQGVQGVYRVAVGEPAAAIMKLTRREKADLVIMTTHGKSGLKRALLGSVADEVVRNSKKPVLVVTPQTR